MTRTLMTVLRRILLALPTLGCVAVILVGLTRILPGDPAQSLAGAEASPADVQRIRELLDLDKPFLQQLAGFLSGVVQGDFGTSFQTGQPVLEQVADRLPATILLATTALVIGVLIGTAAGLVAALRRGRWQDHAVSLGSLTGVSLPNFWLGMMLVLVFAVWLRLLPVAGSGGLQYLVLPAIALASTPLALVARLTRAGMLEVLSSEYVMAARAKGVPEWKVIVKHALPTGYLPVLTVIGLMFGAMLGGTVIIETLFAWPGIGTLLIHSIFTRDYPTIQGVVFIFAFLVIVLNALTDILYGVLDPRVRATR